MLLEQELKTEAVIIATKPNCVTCEYRIGWHSEDGQLVYSLIPTKRLDGVNLTISGVDNLTIRFSRFAELLGVLG